MTAGCSSTCPTCARSECAGSAHPSLCPYFGECPVAAGYLSTHAPGVCPAEHLSENARGAS